MRLIATGLLALSCAVVTTPVLADVIPYPSSGTIAPTVDTFASSSNGINIYYFGSGAAFTDFVEVLDLQTGYDSGEILNNHTTVVGSELTVGATPGQINQGDQLVFFIDSPEGKFASLPSYSADGVNHAYITGYSGGMINGSTIPSGIYVGLEDEANGESDFNYEDDPFVFTGVSAPSVGVGAPGVTPEPASFLLLGTGLLGLAGAARRKLLASTAR